MSEKRSFPEPELETLQKRAADAIGEGSSVGREFNRALLESMSDGVVACDAEGVLTLFNRAAREWHGTDPTRLPPEEWAKHYDLYRSDGVTPLPPEEVPLARAFRGEPVADEGMAISVPGRPVRFVLANGSVIRDDAGRKLGAVVVMRDVTELRRVETELRRANEALEARDGEREQRYRDIFDNVLDGVYLLDVLGDGRFRTLEVNPALERLTGIPRALSVGRTQEETAPGEAGRLVNEKYQRCVEAGRPIEEEVALDLPAGRRIFHSTLIPARGPDGRVRRIVGISRDVTDRRRNDAINAARLHLMQFAVTHSLDELLEETLNEAESISGSLIGFFHFVDDDQRSLRLQAWSTRTKARFCKAEGKGRHYPVAEAGVWADCVHRRAPVIHNDYAALPHRKGMPEGHAEVVRELVVPVQRGEKIRAILGVGNKAGDYTDEDVKVVALLADLAWEISERKRAEETLQRLNRQLRAISECNQTLMHASDEQALLSEICRIVCERAGYRMAWVGYAERDAGRSIRPVAQAGDVDGYVEDARLSWGDTERGRGPAGKAVRGGATVWVQDLSLSPEFAPWLDGARKRGFRSAIWLPLKDEAGAVFGVLLIYSSEVDAFSPEEVGLLEELAGDLAFGIMVLRGRAQRKDAERSIALLSFALNNVRESVFLIDEHARIRHVNDEACRILGYEREDLLRRGVAEVDPGFPPERWAAHWEELKEKRALLFEGHHRARDGRVFPVEISANYFEWEGQGYNLALTHDITQRKAAEEALRDSERRYRMAQAIGHVGNWEYDIRTTQFWGSDEAKRIYGFDPEQAGFTTEEVERCIPERERVHQALVDLIERGRPYDLEFEIRPRDGSSPRVITSVAEVQRDEQGDPRVVMGVVQDVTERRKLEDQLRQSQKMEAIGTLAGGVAHDFNNLLTGIIGYGSLMQATMSPDDPLHSSVEQILAASDRAAQLTRGLLAFSRKQVIRLRPVDLREIVRNVEKLLGRLIGEDIALSTTHAGSGDLTVMADAGQIEQVLMNLAVNARDAMPGGGHLSIATRALQLDEDFVAAHGYGKAGRYAQISVSDTGTGMDAQAREKAFEPYFTTKEPGKGTGLGLSIVYGIVKQHGGAIDIYSEPGKGTTFKILLPFVAAAAGDEKAPPLPPPARGTETILLAEDDPTVRRLIGMVLRGHGYRVIEAVDGADALAKLSAHRAEIGLLILDVVMPRKSGREVYDAARAEQPDVRALFVSGYTADIIHKKGTLDEGLNFIAKPLTPSDLLRKVREVLDQGR